MPSVLSVLLIIWGLIYSGNSVSSKIDFDYDDKETVVVTNTTKAEDEDVEVKHTIVVSTKLKNNYRSGLHSGDAGSSTYKIIENTKPKQEDVGEVPVVLGYKAVESTQIRTPDTRRKPQYNPNYSSNRNSRDEYDVYPILVNNAPQWKPSSFFNNINWWRQENGIPYSFERRSDPQLSNTVNFHRKITDEGMREFYCKKCREYQGTIRCTEPRSNAWRETTPKPKVKIDGKLAKLN